jgi:hypothetical protein
MRISDFGMWISEFLLRYKLLSFYDNSVEDALPKYIYQLKKQEVTSLTKKNKNFLAKISLIEKMNLSLQQIQHKAVFIIVLKVVFE